MQQWLVSAVLEGDCEVVLIDGRSGAGKTELTNRLATELTASGCTPEVLRVEDLYPGWDGLAAGSLALAGVLDQGEYRRFDWETERFAEARTIASGRPLLIEGCGALTRQNLLAAKCRIEKAGARGRGSSVLSVWMDRPSHERKALALARDGETYAPHWERWAAQEDAHYAVHRPWKIATVRLPRPDGFAEAQSMQRYDQHC